MNIHALYEANAVSANSKLNMSPITQVKNADGSTEGTMFGNILGAAMESIKETNGYLSDAENEEIKFALGETENAHDLTIALSKASTALQYTVAIRDKFLEAYKEIMQINI